jgi:hypothetical protein
MRLILGIFFCVFIFRQAAMMTLWSFFNTDATLAVDCPALCAAVLLLTVLVVCPRYLSVILLLVAGLALMINGFVYLGTQNELYSFGWLIFSLFFSLGIFLLLGLMLLMYKGMVMLKG